MKGLKNYFAANGKLLPPEGSPRRLTGYPTYAFSYGNTFVLLFDSIIANDSTQLNWVRAQLEGLDRRRYVNVVVVCHHPAFSSGPHGGANVEFQAATMRTLYMLRSAGVEGSVVVEVSTDENGIPDTSAMRVVASTHDLFAASVRQALAKWRLSPRANVRLPFLFVMSNKSATDME